MFEDYGFSPIPPKDMMLNTCDQRNTESRISPVRNLPNQEGSRSHTNNFFFQQNDQYHYYRQQQHHHLQPPQLDATNTSNENEEFYENSSSQRIKSREFDFNKIKNLLHSSPPPPAVSTKVRYSDMNKASESPPPLPAKQTHPYDFHQYLPSPLFVKQIMCQGQEKYGDIRESQEYYGDVHQSQESYGDIRESDGNYEDVNYGDIRESEEDCEMTTDDFLTNSVQHGDYDQVFTKEHYYTDANHVQNQIETKPPQEDSGFSEEPGYETSPALTSSIIFVDSSSTLPPTGKPNKRTLTKTRSDTSNTRRLSGIGNFFKKGLFKKSGRSMSDRSVSPPPPTSQPEHDKDDYDDEDEDDYNSVAGFAKQSSNNLNNFKWFRGKISRVAADKELENKEGAFLVKESERCIGDYSLYVCHRGQIHRFRITKDAADQYQLGSYKAQNFFSIPDLVNFYRKNVLLLETDEQILLTLY